MKNVFFIGLLALTGCSQPSDSVVDNKYQATITYTEFGIPHISAKDFASLGYGEGYAAAKDQICNISWSMITARGEKAKYLGAGKSNQYVMEDTVVKALKLPQRTESNYPKLSANVKDMLTGYAAGFNRFLTENPNFESWCSGSNWVKPISAQDIYLRSYHVSQTLPRIAAAIYSATPPGTNHSAAVDFISDELLAQSESHTSLAGMGSNAWAIGKQLSATGKGMLIGNPHYPWFGTNRFWEKHLTIPGQFDIYGVSITGIPNVLIGFNDNIAWSHTVSNSQRIALYKLQLKAGNATSYLYEGQYKALSSDTVTVEVIDKQSGEIESVVKDVWFSHHGPIVQFPGLKWSENTAFAVRDANLENSVLIEQWFAMGKANSMQEFKYAHQQYNAMPWVNTIATSKEGDAVYLDNSSVGHLSIEAIKSWQQSYDNNAMVKTLYDDRRLTLLDGSRALFDWVQDDSVPVPATVPFAQRPQITRADYVFNSNDSYWLSNPNQPLSNYSPLYGAVDTPRSLRTRMNIEHLESAAAKGSDGKFSLQELQQSILSNQALSAQLLLPELIAACAQPMGSSRACQVIKTFNGHFDKASKGALLFREWLQAYKTLTKSNKKSLFAHKFDPQNPVKTPYGLSDKPLALQALKQAAQLLERAGYTLDATLGDAQIAYRGETQVPIHGGFGAEGVANLLAMGWKDTEVPVVQGKALSDWSKLTDKGYPITYGTSFIYSLAYTERGPQAQAFLTYGQKENPNSAEYANQTQRFADKNWRDIYFKAEDVKANARQTLVIAGE
ncbi:penicillin acylase family protein [Thalassotalea sp. ND16A]|uniref:penicillin acylase family protein n=1 Tax=Thalassotalea sp. ND16A TaxID=1535422 RepID=UPI00051D800A|nr:penicillin acylase family protein [Thalassotalea sp. ND16A]KGJ92440.1 hypothetical protein ND16A_1618 [Thalassotalea sp. ND16A]